MCICEFYDILNPKFHEPIGRAERTANIASHRGQNISYEWLNEFACVDNAISSECVSLIIASHSKGNAMDGSRTNICT